MKLILIHADPVIRNSVRKQIEDLDHLVVAEPVHPGQLLVDVARHQPQAILAGTIPAAFESEMFPPLGDNVATVPVIRLQGAVTDDTQLIFLKKTLETIRVQQQSKPIRPYSDDGQRVILHDYRYESFAQDEKLGTELPSDSEAEKELFVTQVDCARKNHQSAQHYLNQLLETDYGLRTEISYRIVHVSYKVMWARDHALRFASVLAHYIRGVEIEYLSPPTSSPSTQLDFVHYEATPDATYAAAAMVGHGFQSSLLAGFRSILAKKYTGQSAEVLQSEAIVLLGWCSFLREVALAQVRLMDQVLDLDSPWYSEGMPKRAIHRSEGIFGDFWGLPSLRRNPARMRELAKMVLLEGLSPSSQVSVVAPYRAFFEAHQSSVELSSHQEGA